MGHMLRRRNVLVRPDALMPIGRASRRDRQDWVLENEIIRWARKLKSHDGGSNLLGWGVEAPGARFGVGAFEDLGLPFHHGDETG